MFLYNFFWDTMYSLGLYNKTGKIVFMGLDNAGKTTLLHMLRDNRLVQHMPTQKPTMESLQMNGLTLQTFDLGGHAIARRVWAQYTQDVDGVVFVLDSANRERFAEASSELDVLFETESLKSVPFLILGNKLDSPSAVSEDEIRDIFGLYQTYGKGIGGTLTPGLRPVELFMCSVIKRQGYSVGFKWLAQFIQ